MPPAEPFLVQPTPPEYAPTRDRLLADLRTRVPDATVHEIGSTAIEGCIGKGDLDVLVRAPADRFEAVRAALDAAYPRNPAQLSNAAYQGYTVPAPFDAALQLTIADGPHDDFLPFLDALRADPDLVQAYNGLKRAWNGRAMDAYRGAKSRFVEGVLHGTEALEPVPESCDVAIVGGSLAGVALAAFLAREGVDVVLLEACRFLGDGASGRGTGPVERNVVEHPHRTIRALGDRMAGLLDLTARNRALLAAEGLFDPCGALWVALRDLELPEIASSVEALANVGIPAESWSPAQVAERTGAALGPALFLPEDGRIDPFGALQTFADRAVAAGARIVCDARAAVEDGEPLTLVARGHRLTAELVVFAAGQGCGALDTRLGAGLTAVRDQALLTAPTALPDPGFGRAGQGYTVWRPHPSGGVLVSGARWATPHMEVGESDPSRIESRIQGRLEAFLRDSLGVDAPIADRWAWVFTNTRDGLPIVGPLPGQARRIALTGFGANPASFAVGAARAVADGILGVDGPGVPALLSSRRLVRWRLG